MSVFARRATIGGTCPMCKQYRMTGSFCPVDGYQLKRLACENCDEEYAASQKFCGQCGSPVQSWDKEREG